MKLSKILASILFFTLLNTCKKEKEVQINPEILPKRVIFNDLVYATAHQAQKMDIYLPEAKSPFPVVVLIHGGAWIQGDKKEYLTSAKTEALLKKGYAVVAVNYRLSSVAKFPAQIFDIKAAIRFIRANALKYSFNPNKIGAWGTSAGGHLTALLATSGNENTMEDKNMGNANFSSTIQAAVDWFGPTDFLQMDNQVKAQGCNVSNANHDLANSPESQLMGFAIQTKPEITQTANPIKYVSANDCPIFIMHGAADCTVPTKQSQILFDALLPLKNANDVKYEVLTASGHGTGKFEQAATVSAMVDFFDKFLK